MNVKQILSSEFWVTARTGAEMLHLQRSRLLFEAGRYVKTMTVFREFVKIYKETGSVVWVLFLSVSMPLAGTVVSIYYINEIDQLIAGRGTVSLFLFTFAATLLVGLAFLPSYILAVLCGWCDTGHNNLYKRGCAGVPARLLDIQFSD